jgi:hypothetical protein
MNSKSNTTSSITELKQALNRPQLTAAEVFAESKIILLGDACSSVPNFRASEFVLAANYAKQGVTVATNFYPNTSISYALKNTPLAISELTIAQGNMPLFVDLYGDITARIQNKVARMQQKGATEAEINSWINKYLASLPAQLFSTTDGCSFTQAVVTKRQELFNYFANLIGADANLINVECYQDLLSKVSIRDVLANNGGMIDFVGKLVCPECSLSREEGEDLSEHVIGADGSLCKSYGAYMAGGSKLPNCGFATITAKYGNLIDAPVSTLLGLGIQLSGKLMYMLEAFIYQNPDVALGIRDYSNPRGTVAQAAKQWSGLPLLTPRVYIRTAGRDATGFELAEWIERNGSQGLIEFMQQLPLESNGKQYEFLITPES